MHFLVRACLGEPYRAFESDAELVKPPERLDRRGPFSSVVPLTQSDGGVVKHPECVVYDKSQTLVEYAIWYKHTPECLCTHCVTLSRCIIVRTLFNEQIELQMRGLDTIKDLKVKISNTSFIPEDEQEIIFKAECLCDAHTLAHYEIATGSVLNLVVHSKMGRSVSLNEPKPSAIQRFVASASPGKKKACSNRTAVEQRSK